nr:PREDICTED: uncharacterized protein LOC109043392 [Bemisia tabaci]XP_018916127.1 PREDICTED: uncharacterized protein LOC109043392 [Bemisia tabaci]XP_018916129.1 PREDICTED: uncharacterized protein LOC109043392 [Bemisia tabaci]
MKATKNLFSPMLPVLTIFILVFASSIHGQPPFTRSFSRGSITVMENGKEPRTTEMPPEMLQQIFSNLRAPGRGITHPLLNGQGMPGLSRSNSGYRTPLSPSRSYSGHRMASPVQSPMSSPYRRPPGSPQGGRQSPRRWHSQPQSFQHSPSFRSQSFRPGWSPSVPRQSSPSQPQHPAQMARRVIQLVNAERAANGLQPLAENQKLDMLATTKSRDMRDNGLKSPAVRNSQDMMTEVGIRWLSTGENMAAGPRTPEQVMNLWMNSPGNREHILNPKFAEIGVGYVEGDPSGPYWTQMLLRQATSINPAECRRRVVELVNIERRKAGLAPLKENRTVSKLATMKSADMRDLDYVEHESPTYGGVSKMMTTYGVNWQGAGENIAAGQDTPEEVMDGWMNSPGHRKNIMSPLFTEIGVGYEEGGRLHKYWTQMFLKPMRR